MNMALLLLQTKLFKPPLRPTLVPRPRLIAELNEGLFGPEDRFASRLTLVAAPAGFGKTTLLATWLAELAAKQDGGKGLFGIPSAWLSLDEGDNDLARFLAYFLASLGTIHPELIETATALLESPQPPRAEALLTVLINDIAGLSSPFILALDDYHTITAPAIHRAMTFLLEHMPSQMHLAITTRVEPPFPLARMRGRGQLNELREADLRFTEEETGSFLDQIGGQSLTAGEVSALTQRTEGWIAGLQMVALSMQGRENVAGFVGTLTGSHTYIADYLTREVLNQQPEELRRFLLQTSVLKRLSGPLVEAVTGQSDGQWMLEALSETNLFLIALDEERRWYRYHQLFSDLLRQRLRQDHGQEIPILHRRASLWFEENGFTAEAIWHAQEARDYERAADLIEGEAEATMMRSEAITFLHWVNNLPEEIVRTRPLLCIYQAAAMFWSNVAFEDVIARLDDAIKGDVEGQYQGEILAFKAIIAAYQGELLESATLAGLALEQLPQDRLFFRAITVSGAGLAFLWQGDVANAGRFFDEAVRIADQTKNRMAQVLARSHQGEVDAIRGHLPKAMGRFEEALGIATVEGDRRLPIAGSALINMGRILYEWNDLGPAETCIREGIELVQGWASVAAMGGYALLAFLRQVRGDIAGARDEMANVVSTAKKFDAMTVDDDYYAAFQARLWTLQGDFHSANRWAQGRGLVPDGDWPASGEGRSETEGGLVRNIECLTAAQLWIAQALKEADEERMQAGLELATRVQCRAKEADWGSILVRVLIQKAIAQWYLGEEEQAIVSLAQALEISEPDGYIRIYLDEGQPILDLLPKAGPRSIGPEYMSQLLAAFGEQPPVKESRPAAGVEANLIEPLSDREVEVLQLIAEGLTNREIARDLVLSPNTVKVHTYNIYGKLGVHNRTQAVARARVLGILDGR